MKPAYADQIEVLQESLANDRAELRGALLRVRRAVAEPLDVQRRIRDRPAPWVLGAALVGLWLGVRVSA